MFTFHANNFKSLISETVEIIVYKSMVLQKMRSCQLVMLLPFRYLLATL